MHLRTDLILLVIQFKEQLLKLNGVKLTNKILSLNLFIKEDYMQQIIPINISVNMRTTQEYLVKIKICAVEFAESKKVMGLKNFSESINDR